MSEKTNILLIISDQQRHESVNHTGSNTQWISPSFNRLAEEGTRFSNAYTVCALCSPARASILTGLYPHNHRMWNNCDMFQWATGDLPSDITMISEDLNAAGYNCGYIGKWHIGQERLPSDYGFEGMDVKGYGDPYKTPEYAEYLQKNNLKAPTERALLSQYGNEGEALYGILQGDERSCGSYFLAEETISLLHTYAADDRPFFLVLSLWDPHHPCFPPENWAGKIRACDIELSGNLRENLQESNPRLARWQEQFYPSCSSLSDNVWQEIMASYSTLTAFMDAQIGRVLDALDELGLHNSTAVMATSDHGDMMGAHGGLFDKGPFMYEETYRIPLLVRWPEVCNKGSVADALISNMDIAATILDTAGIQVDRSLDGRSLRPLLENTNSRWKDDFVAEFHGHRYLFSQRMVRWAEYKYVFNSSAPDELYNLDNDPLELNNIAERRESSDLIKDSRKRLLQNMALSNDPLLNTVRMMWKDTA